MCVVIGGRCVVSGRGCVPIGALNITPDVKTFRVIINDGRCSSDTPYGSGDTPQVRQTPPLPKQASERFNLELKNEGLAKLRRFD